MDRFAKLLASKNLSDPSRRFILKHHLSHCGADWQSAAGCQPAKRMSLEKCECCCGFIAVGATATGHSCLPYSVIELRVCQLSARIWLVSSQPAPRNLFPHRECIGHPVLTSSYTPVLPSRSCQK